MNALTTIRVEFQDEDDQALHENVAADLSALVATVYGQPHLGKPKSEWAAINADKRSDLYAFLADRIEEDTKGQWTPLRSMALQGLYAVKVRS